MATDRRSLNLSSKDVYREPEYQQLLKQRQEEIHEKIDKSLEKQKHIIKIQKQLEERLRRKNEEILRKLNKSVQAKKNKIQKIKQNCNLKIKQENQKINAFRKKQRVLLHRSWRQSLKLSQWINKRGSSLNKRAQKSITEQRVQYDEQNQQKDKVLDVVQAKNNKLPSIQISKQIRQVKISQNYVQPVQKIKQVRKNSRIKSEMSPVQNQYSSSFSFVDKLKEKQQIRQKQQLKKYNQKLQKLEQARMKKHKLQKQRQKKIHDELKFKSEKLKEVNANDKKRYKPKTEHKRTKTAEETIEIGVPSTSHKNMLFKRWQQENKLRQMELFQSRIRKGENYLQAMKDKSMKNKMSREVQLNSIEKKLYIQRIKMHQLLMKQAKNTN